nr:ABC transporter ATP-binding protein [Salinibacter ruber]
MLFLAIIVRAVLQVVSVASIMPFLSVASNPESVHEKDYLSWAYEGLGLENTRVFLVVLGVGALVALLLSNAFIVFTTWAMERYVWKRNHSISRRLLQSYLSRPYNFFLTKNSSELGKNILEEVKEITSNMLRPALRGGASAIVSLAIISFLFFVDITVAVVAVLVLGLSYLGLYTAVRNRLDDFGEERIKRNSERYKIVSEAFGGIKQVKLRGKENAFLDQYSVPSRRYSRMQAWYRVIKKAPRYVLEGIAFGGIISIAVYLIAVRGDFRQVIPMLGLYAFAGYRLMPALQGAYGGIASAHFNVAALETLHHHLKEYDIESLQRDIDSEPLELKNYLLLDEVFYTYDGTKEPVIEDLSVKVSAGTTVGFVGKTGSGKTTTVDLILGLLQPQQGKIVIDGSLLNSENVRCWQHGIGYVPQEIYLSDNTIARNIAFGVPENEIDLDAVRDAARRAHICDFVENELPDRWDTVVGERGVKLSGGQRQRIGIARALYHNPSVLVFDEATSALDQSTEASVMEAIYGLEGDHTILVIAHRLSTVRRADKIIMLEDGREIGKGDYDELAEHHSKFQEMAFY